MEFKTFRKKLIKNGFSKGASVVLAALTIVFLILGFSSLWVDKNEAEDLASHKGDMNAYAYLDVVSFDEWVCKYDDE